MSERRLDLRGLKCPMPALLTRKALRNAAAGDILVIECTDPLSRIDIPHLLGQSGDALESREEQNGVLVFRVRKSGP